MIGTQITATMTRETTFLIVKKMSEIMRIWKQTKVTKDLLQQMKIHLTMLTTVSNHTLCLMLRCQ